MIALLAPTAPIPRAPDEALRLAELYKYKLLDTESIPDFDLLVELAADICFASHAFLTLVDDDCVWLKSTLRASDCAQVPRNDDYCSWAILEDKILHIPDLLLDARTANLSKTLGEPHYRMYCGANLVGSGGQRLGTLCVLDTVPRALSAVQQGKLIRMAGHVVSLMESRLRDIEYRSAVDDLSRLATRDELTGLLNRRALMQVLDQEVARSRRFGSDLGVLMVDLDHFKQVNDRYGHGVGDAVLRGVARAVQAGVRGIDFVGRYGGEELCIVLPNTDLAGATKLAESVRNAVAAAVFRDSAADIKVTVSIGVSATGPMLSNTGILLKAADVALYQAKANGRNQVVVG